MVARLAVSLVMCAQTAILKPLKGVDPEIWESFCSHCEQKYPQFELIFGVSDAEDPAIEVVRKLQIKYPNRRIELVDCDRILGANIKVSNLVQMLPAAPFCPANGQPPRPPTVES